VPFWEGLDKGQLYYKRCTQSGNQTQPAPPPLLTHTHPSGCRSCAFTPCLPLPPTLPTRDTAASHTGGPHSPMPDKQRYVNHRYRGRWQRRHAGDILQPLMFLPGHGNKLTFFLGRQRFPLKKDCIEPLTPQGLTGSCTSLSRQTDYLPEPAAILAGFHFQERVCRCKTPRGGTGRSYSAAVRRLLLSRLPAHNSRPSAYPPLGQRTFIA